MGGGSKSSGSGGSSETSLTRAQGDLLKQREQFFQTYFAPYLIQETKAAFTPGAEAPDTAAAAGDVNRAFAPAANELNRSLAQRGVAPASGANMLAQQSLQAARSSALADAYMKARSGQQGRQMQLLQMGGALAPTPTTAAPMQSSESSKSTSSIWNMWGLG